MTRTTASVILSLIFFSCGGETGNGSSAALAGGGYSVSIDAKKLEIGLSGKNGTLLRFPADGLQLGAVDKIEDNFNYDPWLLTQEDIPLFTPPEGLRWLLPEKMSIIEKKDAYFTVSILFDEGKKASLRVSLQADGRFRAGLRPEEGGPQIAYLRLRPRAFADEAFYGLGAYLDDVNNRGKIRAMQLEADLDIESDYNEAHVPVPFVIGTKGWGLFVENNHLGVFDAASKEDDLIEITFGAGAASSEGLVFHLFAASSPLDVTKLYYDVTGYPAIPARWALGPWIWRDENQSQAQVEGDLNAMRDLDVAGTAIWIDRPYASAVNSFDFDPGKFGDAQAMIDLAHDLGFRMALWHTPYLEDTEPCKELRDYAKSHGFFPPKSGFPANSWSEPLDFTNPDAYSWWQGLIGRYTAMGIEGYKLDFAEDVFPSIFGKRNAWQFSDGSDERTMHRGYKLLYHRAYAETLPDAGGYLLCRAGTYGDQASVSVIWPGDLDSAFWLHGEEATGEDGKSFRAVGGLPASMIYGLTLGPSGFPFYGADTGGYRHAPPDKELFTRWFEQTALSTVMQVGNNASTVPWEADAKTGYDEEMLGWYRTYARLHLRLFPYEWTYAQNIRKDGRPIQRPLGLAYPELGAHPWDEYMFGENLLVAPVLRRGEVERDVLFPAGRWADWWSGEVREGGKTVAVEAPLEKLPLFLKEGGIVPLLRPTIDAMAPAGQPDRVDSFSTTAGLIYARVFAGPASRFTLFDGAEITQEKDDGKTSLSWKDGTEFKHGAVFELVAFGEKPASVKDNGSTLGEASSVEDLEKADSGWFYAGDAGGSVFVKVEPGEHDVEVGE